MTVAIEERWNAGTAFRTRSAVPLLDNFNDVIVSEWNPC